MKNIEKCDATVYTSGSQTFLFRGPNIYLKMVRGSLLVLVVTFYNDGVSAIGAVQVTTAQWLVLLALNRKVMSSILRQGILLLCSWERHFTVLSHAWWFLENTTNCSNILQKSNQTEVLFGISESGSGLCGKTGALCLSLSSLSRESGDK